MHSAQWHSISAGKPWTDYFPQGEVCNDGRALIATLRTENPRIYLGMVVNRESLLMWDE